MTEKDQAQNIDESILLSYIHNKLNSEDKKKVECWLRENPANEKQLEQIAKLYYAQRTYNRINSRNAYAAYDRVQHRINIKSRNLIIYRITAVAASIALLVAVSLGTYYLTRQQMPEAQIVTMYANAGMRTEFNMSDGTKVCLNAGSTLKYSVPFEGKQRKVFLDGEGFFSVAHDAKHPFIVSTKNDKLQIEVLGTEFNVQAYKEDKTIKTTLVKGKVKLNISENGKNISQTLLPSERAIYNIDENSLNIKNTNVLYDIAWKDGILMFKNTPLTEVLGRLSHFYDVSFEIRDKIIETYTFTGTFENRQLSQILDYLHISSNINYKIVNATEDDSNGIKRTKVILEKPT